jgi:hypothetical protein
MMSWLCKSAFGPILPFSLFRLCNFIYFLFVFLFYFFCPQRTAWSVEMLYKK